MNNLWAASISVTALPVDQL